MRLDGRHRCVLSGAVDPCGGPFKPLNNNRTCSTSTITDSRTPDLAALLSQHAQQRRHNPCPTCPQRMAQRHCSAMQIHLLFAKAKKLHIRQCDDAERLVDLKRVDRVLSDRRMLERFRNRQSW